jgi:hypothetical protein
MRPRVTKKNSREKKVGRKGVDGQKKKFPWGLQKVGGEAKKKSRLAVTTAKNLDMKGHFPMSLHSAWNV